MKTLIIIIMNVFVLIMLAVMVFYTVSGEVSLSFAKLYFAMTFIFYVCLALLCTYIEHTNKRIVLN